MGRAYITYVGKCEGKETNLKDSGVGGRIILDLKEIGWEFYVQVFVHHNEFLCNKTN
jgi:hypothetical protein